MATGDPYCPIHGNLPCYCDKHFQEDFEAFALENFKRFMDYGVIQDLVKELRDKKRI